MECELVTKSLALANLSGYDGFMKLNSNTREVTIIVGPATSRTVLIIRDVTLVA